VGKGVLVSIGGFIVPDAEGERVSPLCPLYNVVEELVSYLYGTERRSFIKPFRSRVHISEAHQKSVRSCGGSNLYGAIAKRTQLSVAHREKVAGGSVSSSPQPAQACTAHKAAGTGDSGRVGVLNHHSLAVGAQLTVVEHQKVLNTTIGPYHFFQVRSIIEEGKAIVESWGRPKEPLVSSHEPEPAGPRCHKSISRRGVDPVACEPDYASVVFYDTGAIYLKVPGWSPYYGKRLLIGYEDHLIQHIHFLCI
jgi:hypothetical protein